jgi:hypothetical protein
VDFLSEAVHLNVSTLLAKKKAAGIIPAAFVNFCSPHWTIFATTF